MYAQVISCALRSDVLPALRAEPGFSGALSLVDPETADALLFVFWEAEEQATRAVAALAAAACTPDVLEVRARG